MVGHFITLVKQEAEAVASFVPRFECSCVEEERRTRRSLLGEGEEEKENNVTYTDTYKVEQ